MAKMITGSICLTELNEKAKAGHSAFSRAQNGKIYFNVLVWENDQPDKYGNNFSVQLNAKKDAAESEKKQYIGNLKYLEGGAGGPANVTDSDIPDEGKLPF